MLHFANNADSVKKREMVSACVETEETTVTFCCYLVSVPGHDASAAEVETFKPTVTENQQAGTLPVKVRLILKHSIQAQHNHRFYMYIF